MTGPSQSLFHLLLAILVCLTLLLVIVLVLVRVVSELRERRATRLSDELRREILTALLGEGEQAAAMARLRARRGRAWRRVERQAFAMLPKIKGEARDALVSLLLSRGAAGRAHRGARARSAVRRSRGAYELGVLGDPEALRTLFDLLRSTHFLVRRTAVRALGQIGSPLAVTPLLDAVTEDPALARDVITALQRIGPEATPILRHDLDHLLDAAHSGRRGPLVATALGLHGDLAAAPILVRALEEGTQPSQRGAAAQALGEIGAPSAVPALLRALAHADTEVRVRAAVALGQIGDAGAVPALAASLGAGVHVVDRAVAEALARLGPTGRAALAAHPSRYAAEVLAVERIRVSA